MLQLEAAERNLSDIERFKYCMWLKQAGISLNVDHSMTVLQMFDKKLAKKLIWC